MYSTQMLSKQQARFAKATILKNTNIGCVLLHDESYRPMLSYYCVLIQSLFDVLRKLIGLVQKPKLTVMSVYIAPVSKLSSRVVRILGCNPGHMTLQGTNTYVIGTGSRRILLDTGEKNRAEYINNLKNFLTLDNIHIEHIIISHWHRDHIGGLGEVLAMLSSKDCQVWKYKRADAKEDIYNDEAVKELQDGQSISSEGVTVRIIHTPGHTTDHIVLHLQEENAIFSGDCILGEATSVFEDLTDYIKSLQKIKNLNPFIIYPGHGPEIKDNVLERVQSYLNHRIKRENDILSVLREPVDGAGGYTAADIVDKLYKGTSLQLRFAAMYNVKGHLRKLLKEGRVQIVGDDSYTIRNKL